MIRNSKKTIDIAIFTFTYENLFLALEEAFNRGIKMRIIADDEQCKTSGSYISKIAALGIPTKTDCNKQAHMHHKFAVVDNSVVLTGSFNWTLQAVKTNQENILFYENKDLAAKYTEEFNRLWDLFVTVIDQALSLRKIKEEEDRKIRAKNEREKQKQIRPKHENNKISKTVKIPSERKENLTQNNINRENIDRDKNDSKNTQVDSINQNRKCIIF